jgi:hypothetical protein
MVRLVSKTVSVILLGAALVSCCHLFLPLPVVVSANPGGCHNHGKPHLPTSHQCCVSASHDASVMPIYEFALPLQGVDAAVLSDGHRFHECLPSGFSICYSPPSTAPLRI